MSPQKLSGSSQYRYAECKYFDSFVAPNINQSLCAVFCPLLIEQKKISFITWFLNSLLSQ